MKATLIEVYEDGNEEGVTGYLGTVFATSEFLPFKEA
jgi:hypothetical protein